jgi:FKBP-type peptidyl-prolyl cis-trans isomerase FklB
MPNLQTLIRTVLAGAALLGTVFAQQTPASTAQSAPAPATSAPATPTAKTSSAKPHTATAARPPLKTQKDKFSYAIGMNLGSNLKKQNVPIDPAIMTRGLRDALAGTKPQLTEEEARAAIAQVQQDVQKKGMEKMQAESAVNKKEADAFLAANKAKPDVVTLPSGLQYKILTAGTGAKPTASDTVVCNYRGTLINGKEFDSSYKRGQPATFPVSGVIKGWTEALQLMPVGSKWQLFIPADLAYGDRSPSPDIAPGDMLIFEVELMSIQDKAKDADKK